MGAEGDVAVSIAVLIPVLRRPERVEPLVESWWRGWATDRPTTEQEIVFVVNDDDTDEQTAVLRAARLGARMVVVPWEGGSHGDYARKINAAARVARDDGHEWVFMGADDLCFCPGWADRAIDYAGQTAMVIGTNDLGNPQVIRGHHATHSLVRTAYLDLGTIDQPNVLLHEGYRHNWVDTEFVGTAKHRGVFAFCRHSHVEHLHPHWGKGDMDDTYRAGLDAYTDDQRLYNVRRRLWER